MKFASVSAEELVKACAESESADAWEEFVHRFQKVIASAVQRVVFARRGRDPSLIEELIQDTFLKICADNRRFLREFEPRHPDFFCEYFCALLKVTAGNLARDHFRKPTSRIVQVDLAEIEMFVADGRGKRRIEREILLKDIDQILLANPSRTAGRDRDIFWLYYRQGFTAAEIAGMKHFGIDTKGVESVLHRLRCLVCRALAERPEAAESAGDEPGGEPEGNPPKNPLDEGEEES